MIRVCGQQRTNLANDALHFLHTACAGVLVGGPQPCAQQMVAAENVQRQIAVVAVITVEEARFLLAMQRGVGGIQVQHDLLGRLGVGFQEDLHQQLVES